MILTREYLITRQTVSKAARTQKNVDNIDFFPLYCPSCGSPTRLERADNPMGGKLKAKQALSCAICGVMYQLADNTEIFRAATASGGDLVEYFVDEDNQSEPGSGN